MICPGAALRPSVQPPHEAPDQGASKLRCEKGGLQACDGSAGREAAATRRIGLDCTILRRDLRLRGLCWFAPDPLEKSPRACGWLQQDSVCGVPTFSSLDPQSVLSVIRSTLGMDRVLRRHRLRDAREAPGAESIRSSFPPGIAKNPALRVVPARPWDPREVAHVRLRSRPWKLRSGHRRHARWRFA